MNDRDSELIQKSLHEWFGYNSFREGQDPVIRSLMAGRSAAAVFPTGSGKSLCYQLPAVLLPGLTIVVSPLIALMKDQIDSLTQRRIAAVRLDSSLSTQDIRETTRRVQNGEIKLLFVAPERFNNESFRQLIQGCNISLFAVDEAHCISEWGHNFRPDYLKLAHYARRCDADRILALTATATRGVLEDICRVFEIEERDAVRTGFFRPNLHLRFHSVTQAERSETLVTKISSQPPGATIIYVTLQRTAVEVAETLVSRGLNAKAYHGGMASDQRTQVQEWFLQHQYGIIVATIAFGMGIDKADIRYVYHYNLPKSLENYSQEIGRAGRDGKVSICETLACADDLPILENFAIGDTPSQSSIDELVREVFSNDDEYIVSIYHKSREFDLNAIVIRTLLTRLELDGFIEGGTPVYNEYRFKFLQPSGDILAHFDPARKEFLSHIFRKARSSRTWLTLVVDDATRGVDSDRSRIVRALDYLSQKGWIELKASQVQHRYRIIQRPNDLPMVGKRLFELMCEYEARQLQRIEQVVALVASTDCQQGVLGTHFGDHHTTPCGECSACQAVAPAQFPQRRTMSIDEDHEQHIKQLRRDHADAFSDPRALARFLCGVKSPSLTRHRLAGHRDFGLLSGVPFAKVLETVLLDA